MMRRLGARIVADVGLSGSAFNPSDKNSNIALSNGNHTAESVGGGWKLVRGTDAKSSGRWYAEIRVDDGVNEGNSIGAGDVFIGLDNGAGGLSSYPGTTSGNVGYYCRGGYYTGWSVVGDGPFWGSGRVLGIAYDADSGKVWFSRDGVFAGDPAAGTGAAVTGLNTGQMIALGMNTHGAIMTVRTAAKDFIHAPPSGFVAWG